MSDTNLDGASDGSPTRADQESAAQLERPKSRLPRLPQASKQAEFEGNDSVKTPVKSPRQTEVKLNTHALSVRQYLEKSVVPVLMEGLTSLVRERPEDPVEYLAAFLRKNNPKRPSGEDEVDA